MNTKITYAWTKHYDESIPNNGFEEETDYIITDGVYNFADFLHDNDVNFFEEYENNAYWVLDENEERTGEVYLIVKMEPTTEKTT